RARRIDNYSRLMLSAVINGVFGFDWILGKFDCLRSASLRIWVVERRTGAGDGDADAVAGVEDLADPTDVEFEFVNFGEFEKHLMIEPFAIAGALGIVANQDRAAIGVDVADTNEKIGVASRGGDEQLGANTAGPFNGSFEGFAGKRANIGLCLEGSGVFG